MKLNYYIHGLPKGFDYIIGEETSKNFFQEHFYTQIFGKDHNDGERGFNELRIEYMPGSDNKRYFYYTFFMGREVLRDDSRRGYIALTVRIDSYYKCTRNLLFLLDSFFRGYIQKELFQNNSLKFKVSDLHVFEPKWDSICPALENLIGSTFNEEDLINITANETGKYLPINLADATDEYVEQAIKKYGAVSISEVHPSIAVKNFDKQKQQEIAQFTATHNQQIAQIKQEADSRISQAKQELENVKQQYKQSSSKYSKLSQQLDAVTQQKNEKEDLLRQVKKLVNNIPLQETAPPDYMPTNLKGSKNGNKPHRHQRQQEEEELLKSTFSDWLMDNWLRLILAIIAVVAIGGIGYWTYKSFFPEPIEEDNDDEQVELTIQGNVNGEYGVHFVGDTIQVSMTGNNSPAKIFCNPNQNILEQDSINNVYKVILTKPDSVRIQLKDSLDCIIKDTLILVQNMPQQ